MKKLLIASTSTLHGQSYLTYLKDELANFFDNIHQVLFVPYARPAGISHDKYTAIASAFFDRLNIKVNGLHTFDDPARAIAEAKGIFVGGGNTFVLADKLHRLDLMAPLRQAIFKGTPYLGTSAGSNITGVSMQTTNDMPIVYPPSFKTLGAIGFNINPHYLDPLADSTHMGESRETRIAEFHTQNNIPVLGLREGSWLTVQGDSIQLKGKNTARLFRQKLPPIEIDGTFDFSELT